MAYDLSIAQLRDTAAQLKATNATIAAGRLCKETDAGRWKVGTGAAYNSTDYTLLDGDEERSADDVYAAMTVSDGRDEAGSGTVTGIHQGPYQAGLTLNFHDTVSHLDQIFEWQGTETVSTNWATDSTNFGLAIAANLTAVAAVLPKRYKFTGDGGAATGTIGVNTFPMAVTVANPGAGRYSFTAASGTPFTAGKTYVTVIAIEGSNPLACRIDSISTSVVEVGIFDTTSGTPTDPAAGYTITIETEP